ncbi:EAL domain-containing protein [Vibrio sp. Vf1514]|uniref:EAL domain-containing protein n=1 Tax=Vibrio sp. Vf1514 TaxID=3437381 RepID=UPI003F8BE1FC
MIYPNINFTSFNDVKIAIDNIKIDVPFINDLKFEPIVDLDNLTTIAYEMLSVCEPNIDVEASFDRLEYSTKKCLFFNQLELIKDITNCRIYINLPLREILTNDLLLEIKTIGMIPTSISVELQDLHDVYQFEPIEINQLRYQVKKLQALGVELWADDLNEDLMDFFIDAGIHFYGGKIDKETFWTLRKNKKLLNFLIAKSKNFCGHVLIEGIETEKDLKLVRSTKADLAQGHYWAEIRVLNLKNTI